MSLLISGFEGLVARDFDVYQPACWSNNLHNLDRMRTKARVKTLAERAQAALDGEWVVEASSEVPSIWNGRKVQDQWAYVIRPKPARTPMLALLGQGLDLAARIKDPAEHHQHALLSVQIDQARIEVGVRLHSRASVDLRNLLARAEAEPDAFAACLAALPEGVQLDDAAPTAERVLGAARSTLAGDREWLAVGQTWSRDDAVELGIDLIEATATLAAGLAPLFTFLAWSPENDFSNAASKLDAFAAAVDERTAQVEAERAAKVSSHHEREVEARDRTAARVAELTAWKKARPRRPRREETPRPAPRAARPPEETPAADAKPAGEATAAPQRPAREAAPRKAAPRKAAPRKAAPGSAKPRSANPRGPSARGANPRKGPRKPSPRPAAPRAERPAPAPPPVAVRPLGVGDVCRLNRGLLAGKTGEITSVDAKKGQYRVKVGALEVSIGASDLERMG